MGMRGKSSVHLELKTISEPGKDKVVSIKLPQGVVGISLKNLGSQADAGILGGFPFEHGADPPLTFRSIGNQTLDGHLVIVEEFLDNQGKEGIN